MPNTIQIISLIISFLMGLVGLWTAKTVAELKVWILIQEQKAREESDKLYVKKEVFDEWARAHMLAPRSGGA